MLLRRLTRRRQSHTRGAAASAQLVHPDSAGDRPLYAKQMAGYLRREQIPTVLPPPKPSLSDQVIGRALDLEDSTVPAVRLAEALNGLREATMWYNDSQTVDYLGVMDACLHNSHNVPRAKGIFDRLRATRPGVLDIRVYNRVLEAYLDIAENPKPENSLGAAFPTDYWLAELRELYATMKDQSNILPDCNTFAVLIVASIRFPHFPELTPDASSSASLQSTQHAPTTLVQRALDSKVDIVDIISSRVIRDGSEGPQLIKLISRTAVSLGRLDIVTHLGNIANLGRIPSLASQDVQKEYFPDLLDNIDQVRPVTRKVMEFTEGPDGETIETEKDTVPFNLDNLRTHLASATLSRRVLPEDLASRQKLLEESMHEVAVARLEHENTMMESLHLTNELKLKRDSLQGYMWRWHQALQPRLQQEIRNIQTLEDVKNKKRVITPYLRLIKEARLSLIVIMEIMRLSGTGGITDGMKTARALIQVGKAVEIEYKASICKTSNIRLAIPTSSLPGSSSSGANSSQSYFTNMGYRSLQERRIAAARLMDEGEAWVAPWSQSLRAQIGGVLVDCLMEVATVKRSMKDESGNKVEEEQGAFFHTYEHLKGQRLGVIKLNPEIADRLARDRIGSTVHPRHLPMLVKPKPWVNPNNGGYIYSKNNAMRFKESVEQETYLQRASELGQVELVYAGLDVLGSTPWKINEKVFDVVLKQWNTGERLGKMPPAEYDAPEPRLEDIIKETLEASGQDATDPSLSQLDPAMDPVVKRKLSVRARQHANAKGNNHSSRCNVNYKLEIARAFIGDVFYQPHNLDFRGRAYPIPPHLNHIGDDLSRGLLRWAEGKPLGVRGLRWLKIHLANLYGYDKAPFDDRVTWTEERLEQITEAATKPLDGTRWWTGADDPWQCLATCFELHAALNNPDGTPEEFVSFLPVHQDGTCNGLQHYAALGGDAEGAAQVNLSPGNKPSDVYSYVGRMVETTLERDKAAGHPWAALLAGKITRKVVKQTVMTTVYGVTFIGARDQIERQLKDRGDIAPEDCWGSAAYLTRVTLESIGDLFSGATHIQNWLTISARLIAKSIPERRLNEALAEYRLTKLGKDTKSLPPLLLKREQMTSVIWTTPMGLPIVQPYRKTARKQILTALQTIFITDPNSPAEVNAMKQATAFPPNFIHSLDATHMMLTALECRMQDITFAAVHDSYWTHPSAIDKMSEIIRETFVALHSSDILEKLRVEFTERYGNFKLPLLQLRSPGFIKQLSLVGAKINVTPKQARSLRAFTPILNITEDLPSSIDETQAAADVARLLEDAKRDEDGRIIYDAPENEAALRKVREAIPSLDTIVKSAVAGEDAAVDSVGADPDFDNDLPTGEDAPAKTPSPPMESPLDSVELLGRFVRVIDLLPPLPKKGTFSVEEIKNSPYFFS